MPFVDVPGARLHYELHGEDGPPLALTTANGVAASLWGELVPLLAKGCRVLVYDAPGAGRSEAQQDEYTAEQLAEQLHVLAREAFGGPFVSFGHASGAWMAAVHAVHHPEAVSGLVVASFAGFFDPVPGALADSRAMRPSQLDLEEYTERFGALLTGLSFVRTEAGRDFARRHWEAGRARSGSSAHGPALRDVDRNRYWGAWTVPTLALFGTHDKMAPPTHGFDLERRLPDVEVQFRYPAGHFLPMEQPEWVAEQVIAFVRRVSG